MSRGLKIVALVLIYLLVCAKSCDNEERGEAYREQRQATLAADSLRNAACLDSPDGGALEAYAAEALVLFSDYADYLAIAADTATAPAFREKVRAMIRGMVYPGTDPADKPFKIITASVGKPFDRVNDSLYEGSVHYAIVPSGRPARTGPNAEMGSTGAVISGFLPIFLARQNKIFGPDTLQVWTIFLGKME
jgi:hypothetical protein